MSPNRLLVYIQTNYNDLEHICKLSTMFKLECLEPLWVPWSRFLSILGGFDREEIKESKVGLGKGVQPLLTLSNFQGLKNSLSNFNVHKHYLGNLLKI